jgi:deoxyadenosine/deoxycytidine kinase
MTVVCITGNIASGKSTLGELLSRHFEDAVYVPEPHLDNPFLPLYLRDKARWGFTAQLRYFTDYARIYREVAQSHRIVFVDAGVWTNEQLYTRMLKDENILSADEFAFYRSLCAIIRRAESIPNPDAWVFVHAAPEVCLARMHTRGWEYQTGAVTLDYIALLDRYLRSMREMIEESSTAPVLTISSETDDFTTPEGEQAVLNRVRHFLHNLPHA